MKHVSRGGVNKDSGTHGLGAYSKCGMVNPVKVKLFSDMFNFLSLYYGSDNATIKKLGIKDKFIRCKMKDRLLNKDNAQKILDGYNDLK